MQLVLEGKPQARIDDVLTFSTAVGLPMTLGEVGLAEIETELLARKHLREVQPLLPLLQPYLEEFASRSSPCMEEHDCHVLSSVAAAD